MDFTYRRWPAMPSARPDLIERGDRINALCARHDPRDRPVFNAIYRLMRDASDRNGERLTRLLAARAYGNPPPSVIGASDFGLRRRPHDELPDHGDWAASRAAADDDPPFDDRVPDTDPDGYAAGDIDDWSDRAAAIRALDLNEPFEPLSPGEEP